MPDAGCWMLTGGGHLGACSWLLSSDKSVISGFQAGFRGKISNSRSQISDLSKTMLEAGLPMLTAGVFWSVFMTVLS